MSFQLSTLSETKKGEEIKTTSYQGAPIAPFSLWDFTMVTQSCRDVPLLETTVLFLLEVPPCQRIKMLFLAKNFKLSKLVVHFWRSMNHIKIVI